MQETCGVCSDVTIWRTLHQGIRRKKFLYAIFWYNCHSLRETSFSYVFRNYIRNAYRYFSSGIHLTEVFAETSWHRYRHPTGLLQFQAQFIQVSIGHTTKSPWKDAVGSQMVVTYIDASYTPRYHNRKVFDIAGPLATLGLHIPDCLKVCQDIPHLASPTLSVHGNVFSRHATTQTKLLSTEYLQWPVCLQHPDESWVLVRQFNLCQIKSGDSGQSLSMRVWCWQCVCEVKVVICKMWAYDGDFMTHIVQISVLQFLLFVYHWEFWPPSK